MFKWFGTIFLLGALDILVKENDYHGETPIIIQDSTDFPLKL